MGQPKARWPTRYRWVARAAALAFLLAAPSGSSAQDVFSSGDQPESGGNDVFNDNPVYGSSNPGDCVGINVIFNAGRCNPRPLPGYTGCGPYYNNYQYFLQATLKHLGGACEVRAGGVLWCPQRRAGMCNPDAGSVPGIPLVDTGIRFDQQCQSHCDPSVGQGNNPGGKGLQVKPMTPGPVTPRPSTQKPTPTDGYLIEIMTDCLATQAYDHKLTYYHPPQVSKLPGQMPPNQPVSYANGTLTYDPTALAQQPLTTRVFLLARAYAEDAQAQRDQAYGPSAQAQQEGTGEDAIVGFLDRCLMANRLVPMPTNLSPNDPRILYGNFIGQNWRASPAVNDFATGFQYWPLFPLSLLPPE